MNYKELNEKSASILIVEDELMVAMDIEETLRRAGYGITGSVSSGEKALKTAAEKQPDLILMDIKIKGNMDGIETAEKILSHYDIPVIYLTAYADSNSVERAKSTAPYGYIIKPYDEKRLQTTIDMALYKHRLEKKLKQNQQWLSVILENIGEALIVADSTGRIKLINNTAETLTGWTKEEANEKKLTDIFRVIDENTNTLIENPLLLVFREGKAVTFKNQILLINKNKNKKPILATASPIKDEQGINSGVILLFQDITDMRVQEEERENLLQKVTEAQGRLKILSRRLIEVQESERGKISRELHDEIGQSLTAVKISLQTIKTYKDIDKIISGINDSVDLIEHSLNQVRNLSLDLRPSMLDDLGLIPAVRGYINRQANRAGIEAIFKADPIDKELNPGLQITCYRVIQEAITNILRHSNAKTIKIEMRVFDNKLHLKILDDGSGFNVKEARQKAIAGKSIGILGMQERVELIGGTFEILSSEKGTEIHVIFPLD